MVLLSAKLMYAEASTDSLLEVSEQYLYQARFEKAYEMLDSVLEQAKSEQQILLYYEVLNLQANVLTRMGEYDSAYSMHSEVLRQSVNRKLTELEFQTKYYQGVLKLFLSEFDWAKQLFLEVVDYFRVDPRENHYLVARSLTNLAFLVYQEGGISQARQYLEKSREYYLDDPLNIHASSNYILEGLIYLNEGKPELAEQSYLLARKIYREYGRVLNLSGLFLNLSSLYEYTGDDQLSEAYLDSARRAGTNPYLPRELQTVYDHAYRFYYIRGNYQKAIDMLLRRDHIVDSLQSTDLLLKVAKLEDTSAEKLRDLKLTLLQEQLMAEQKNNKVQRILIFVVIVITIYLFVFIMVYRRLIREKNKSQQELLIKNNQLRDKNLQIAKAQKMLIKSEKMALLGRISAGIAHEINTPIGAIKGNLELIKNLQYLEFDKLKKVYQILTNKEIEAIFQLMVHSINSTGSVTDLELHRESKKKIEKFFDDVDIENKSMVVDFFAELNVDEELHKYTAIYSHQQCLDILELVTYIVNRYSSTNTALVATGKALKILKSFKTYSFSRGWKDIKTIDLSESFDVMLNLYKSDLRYIKVNKEIIGDTRIEGIQDELDQVWTNLISNAIYAMSSEGEMNITLTGTTNAVAVSIEDTGGGVSIETGQDIFEPFYTTKPEGEGSGLGLDICKQIVKNHYGSISWQNTERGAKFTVILPRSLDKSLLIDE